jgi:predicted transcriptional regulator
MEKRRKEACNSKTKGQSLPILVKLCRTPFMWLKRQSGVPKASLEQLGSLETEVMDRIWARGEISVRDLHQELAGRLAYTTVMTTLDRLYKKGLLQRRKQGKAFLYVPACTEQEYQEQLTGHLFGVVLRENKDSNAVLSCFVETISENDREMLDRLDELVKAKRRALRRKE